MSVDDHDLEPGAPAGAEALLRRAATAEARAEHRLMAAAADLAMPDDHRLDDEARLTANAMLARLVDAIEADLRHYAARLLAGSTIVLPPAAPLADRLVRAGLLADHDLTAELVARARSDILARHLPANPGDEPDRPSLLPRLANDPDRVIASAASALMAAEARRRGPAADAGRDDLPAELQHRLVWWVAAALRPDCTGSAGDTALVDAAHRVLAAHDEGSRIEAVAQRLAAALDPDHDAIGTLLDEALADRRIALFSALLAHALGSEPAAMRNVVLEPEGDRLLLGLRALDLSRGAMSRIGLSLCDADRRRDIEKLPASIDAVMAMTVAAAGTALADLRLPDAYRHAARALGRAQ